MDLLMLPALGLGDLAKAQVPGLGRVLTGDDFLWQRKVWLPSCRDRILLLGEVCQM